MLGKTYEEVESYLEVLGGNDEESDDEEDENSIDKESVLTDKTKENLAKVLKFIKEEYDKL